MHENWELCNAALIKWALINGPQLWRMSGRIVWVDSRGVPEQEEIRDIFRNKYHHNIYLTFGIMSLQLVYSVSHLFKVLLPLYPLLPFMKLIVFLIFCRLKISVRSDQIVHSNGALVCYTCLFCWFVYLLVMSCDQRFSLSFLWLWKNLNWIWNVVSLSI